MAHFTITSDDEFSGATVIFNDGTTQVIGSDNANYGKVVAGLLGGNLTDEELLELISPFELIYKKLTKLSERVSRKGMRLFFDGDPVANALAQHIIKIMDEGAPEEEWQAYIRFWEKVATNPSTKSQDELFLFIEKHGLLLTPDGDAVFYKSTRRDGSSTYAGYGIVDGVEYENANLKNHVGAVVEIPRSMVDGNRGIACSVGLHVGDFSYASTYSDRLWTVLVNPRDVVSVPSDANERKIRVCRYTVIEENADRVKYDGKIKIFDLGDKSEEEVVPGSIASLKGTIAEQTGTIKDLGLPVQNVVVLDLDAKRVVPQGGSRIPEFKNTIKALIAADPETNLSKYKNKKVTQKQRAAFAQAAKELGYEA